ncbi:MAG: RluA family pseudouridine synthase [Oligoflexus sp.]
MSQGPIEKNPSRGEFRTIGGVITSVHVGLRADQYLSEQYPFFSRASWQKRMREGWLLVNRCRIRPSYRLREGDQVELFYPLCAEPDVDRGIYPVWKKGAVMAVYKPGNLPIHENGPYRKNTFAHILQEELGKEWAAVHRLDKETSGIVLCGATYEVRQELSRSLAKRVLDKEYLAIAKGRPKAASWAETGSIGDLSDSPIRIKKWVVPDGLPSETEFEVLEEKAGRVLLAAKPKTGRTNQIRIHAAYSGLPLVGDKLYHPDEQVFLNWFEDGMSDDIVRQTGFRRCLLHAHRLTFIHPETEQIETVVCPMPEDMQEYWQEPDAERWLSLGEDYDPGENSAPGRWLQTLRSFEVDAADSRL